MPHSKALAKPQRSGQKARASQPVWEIAELFPPQGAWEEEDYFSHVAKRRDYAVAGIPEYWIIDPVKKTILVLTLKGKSYRVHGNFKASTRAAGALLPGFSIIVDDLLAAGKE